MADPVFNHRVGKGAVFLFGPQALSFNEDAFKRLRATIQKTGEHSWVLDAIAELPNCLESISHHHPDLCPQSSLNFSLLEDLQRWFATGNTAQFPLNLPNIFLSPLVVITQLIQYVEHRKTTFLGGRENIYKLVENEEEALGLCTGFLSAVVVSSSSDRETFERYGTVAVRLAMLIGLVVDTEKIEEGHGASQSLATIWHSVEEKNRMSELLESTREVRFAVLDD